MNKSEHLRVSFKVRDGKVRRAILDVRQVLCGYPADKTRISTFLDRAKIENGAFKTRYQEHFDNFVIKGTVSRGSAKGTASVKERNNATICRSGKIGWAAMKVRFRKYKAFRDIYDQHHGVKPILTPPCGANVGFTRGYATRGSRQRVQARAPSPHLPSPPQPR